MKPVAMTRESRVKDDCGSELFSVALVVISAEERAPTAVEELEPLLFPVVAVPAADPDEALFEEDAAEPDEALFEADAADPDAALFDPDEVLLDPDTALLDADEADPVLEELPLFVDAPEDPLEDPFPFDWVPEELELVVPVEVPDEEEAELPDVFALPLEEPEAATTALVATAEAVTVTVFVVMTAEALHVASFSFLAGAAKVEEMERPSKARYTDFENIFVEEMNVKIE